MSFDVKITTKNSFLDLFMPYTCRGCGRLGEILCECCKKYNTRAEVIDGWIYTVGKREGVLMKVTEEYKYKSIRKTAEVLAGMLNEVLPEIKGEVAIVPLPTIRKHIRERGFDHTLLLAKKLAKIRKCDYDSLLVRVNKAVQVGSDRETRLKQAKTAYKAVSEAKMDVTYVLLDDVTTTGASLKAAKKVLEGAGAKKIYGVAVCSGLLGGGSITRDSVDDEVDDSVSEERDN